MGAGGYLKLVNGTPYAWKKVDGHRHQMNDATFSDHIGAFSTNTVYFEFHNPALGNWFDSEAWITYEMEGTNFRFCIWCHRKENGPRIILQLICMNTVTNKEGDKIDLGWVENPASSWKFNGVSCIISGRDGAFVTSAARNPLVHKNWMSRELHTIGGLTLREICIPGTHNSGMFKVSWRTPIAHKFVTQNQSRSIKEQLELELGVRFFDLRPAFDEDGKWFYAHHISYLDKKLEYQGALGDWIGYMVNQINEFTRDHKEIIILNISHALNIHTGYKPFDHWTWVKLFKDELDRLENLFVADPGEDITKIKLGDMLDSGRRAAVIIRMDYDQPSGNDQHRVGERHGRGYFYKHNFPLFDEYADANDAETLIDDQVKKMKAQRNHMSPVDGKVFMMSWALTQHTEDAIKAIAAGAFFGPDLMEWARHSMTPRLGVLYDRCFGRCFPNVIGLDGVETTDGLAMTFAINEWQRSKR
ncbi:PLC-like phosphodiesterase [Immersiella caudata]|uniref:PLC-like phosphodiesterase n=1 Tax=Immersiella caudata TaxID=314043 RepID=A0AA39WVK8_9PEZI|nr:PLC-like phosphodiesterase [Immersiella caudata]